MDERVFFYDGDGEKVFLPSMFEVCESCHGTGVKDRFGSEPIPSEWLEDEEFLTDYRSGLYDVACFECDGKRVVSIIDIKKCTPELLNGYYDYISELYELNSIERQERAMGA